MGAKADVWKGHLAAWRSSGLTQVAYCKQHGLSLAGFGYWRRTLGNAAVSSALVPIVIGEAGARDEAIEVRLPNGLQARLPTGMAPSQWAPVIRALRTC